MNILGNILWLLCGGLMVATGYIIGGLLLCLTIIGIPFGIQAMKLATLAAWPIGYQSIPVNSSGSCLSALMNILWIFTGGIWIALTHLAWGIVLCITIIGIPFGLQHFKLMALSFTPFGQNIVPIK